MLVRIQMRVRDGKWDDCCYSLTLPRRSNTHTHTHTSPPNLTPTLITHSHKFSPLRAAISKVDPAAPNNEAQSQSWHCVALSWIRNRYNGSGELGSCREVDEERAVLVARGGGAGGVDVRRLHRRCRPAVLPVLALFGIPYQSFLTDTQRCLVASELNILKTTAG